MIYIIYMIYLVYLSTVDAGLAVVGYGSGSVYTEYRSKPYKHVLNHADRPAPTR